jgi:MFS family permease
MRWIPATQGLPRAFWLLWWGQLINRAGGFIHPFLTIYLVGPRHVPLQRAGAIMGLVGLGAIGAGPVSGTLSDLLGRKKALGIATGLGAGAMLALGLARTDTSIAIAASAVGFCGEMYRAPCQAMVADVVPAEDRARAFGILYWGVNIGFAIASAVAGFIATVSYTALFVGDAATTLLMGVIVLAGVHETRPANREKAPAFHFLKPYGDRTFLGFIVVSSLITMVFSQVGSTLPMELQARGISPRTYGLLLALNGVLIGLLQPFAGTFTRRTPPARVLSVAALVIAVGFVLNDLARGAVSIYALSICVWTMGEIAMAGLTPAIVSEVAPPHLRGSYQGALQLAFAASLAVAPVAGSALLSHFGSSGLWRACGLTGLVASGGFLIFVPARRSAAAVASALSVDAG